MTLWPTRHSSLLLFWYRSWNSIYLNSLHAVHFQNPPYTMLVESHEKLNGNARFEGFAIDLADELSKLLGFNYTFKLVDDGKVCCAFATFSQRLMLSFAVWK